MIKWCCSKMNPIFKKSRREKTRTFDRRDPYAQAWEKESKSHNIGTIPALTNTSNSSRVTNTLLMLAKFQKSRKYEVINPRGKWLSSYKRNQSRTKRKLILRNPLFLAYEISNRDAEQSILFKRKQDPIPRRPSNRQRSSQKEEARNKTR